MISIYLVIKVTNNSDLDGYKKRQCHLYFLILYDTLHNDQNLNSKIKVEEINSWTLDYEGV